MDRDSSTIVPTATTKKEEEKEKIDLKNAVNQIHTESEKPKIPSTNSSSSSVMPINPIKYQYYQSAESLNISILVKGILESEVSHLFSHILSKSVNQAAIYLVS